MNRTFQTATKTAQSFYHAELDPLHSTYKMLMYREGFSQPNTYYSKKKNFEEPHDKEYLMLSMIERFIGKNNCFFRKFEQYNGKMYAPATMIEFWRIFEDDPQERLVLRLFHPTKNTMTYEVFDYLTHHQTFKNRLNGYYELMRTGKAATIGGSKPRRLEIEESKDFFWTYLPEEKFNVHLAELYSKYPSKNRIDIYKETYCQKYYGLSNRQNQPLKNSTIPNHKTTWAALLEVIAQRVDSTVFQTWFLPIKPHSLIENTLTIEVPTMFFYEWIEEYHITTIRLALDSILGTSSKLQYIISK